MLLRESLAGLPTRPVLILSISVIVLGLGYHLYSTYRSCTTHAKLREALGAAIEERVEGVGRGVLRLSEITDFDWDSAQIIVNYKPEGAVADCPFKWDWTRQTREAYIDNDLLSVIVFLREGKMVNYIEYPRNEAEFVNVEDSYSPATAVFRVESPPSGRFDIILKGDIPQ
jgi:hypothetical protein